ncbi:MAG: cellulase family glycosylhydrolase [Isosphaeraceae bacterium]
MTFRTRTLLAFCLTLALTAINPATNAGELWSPKKANDWYRSRAWPVGCNYAPSTAINQLEMWQADTFDPETIDRELGWARELGFNSLRVFLHHLPWETDRDGFLRRIETFLQIADKHGINVMFVLFDAVWDPFPKAGPQRAPKPHVHNSGWVQSPGLEILKDPARHDELESYVKGLIRHFRDDRRVLAWDLFNEPDNRNSSSYERHEPTNKAGLALALLKKEFAWARAADPSQPLTSGVWQGDWTEEKLSPMNRFQLETSDIITFHDYNPLPEVQARLAPLRRYGRPVLCTEYMARPRGSTFDPVLGLFREQRVGAYNWGFVAGKSQTIYPWDSWVQTYNAEPKVWFHDIFRKDGTTYDRSEVEYIKKVTGKTKP